MPENALLETLPTAPIPPARVKPWVGLAVGAVVLLVLAVLLWPRRGSLELGMFQVSAKGAEHRLSGGAKLHAGDVIRFGLTATRALQGYVVGLDSTGRVSLYVPSSNGPVTLEAGTAVSSQDRATVDGAVARERIVALACPAGVTLSDVVQKATSALATAQNDPAKVRVLLPECSEDVLMVEKMGAG